MIDYEMPIDYLLWEDARLLLTCYVTHGCCWPIMRCTDVVDLLWDDAVLLLLTYYEMQNCCWTFMRFTVVFYTLLDALLFLTYSIMRCTVVVDQLWVDARLLLTYYEMLSCCWPIIRLHCCCPITRRTVVFWHFMRWWNKFWNLMVW